MHVDVVYNRGSGRGKAERIATRFARALTAAGITAHLRPVRGSAPNGHTPDLLVLVGGDGTVMHAIDDAIALGAAVYHVPLGNENLFARGFGMTREPGDLLRAIGRWSIDRIDVGVVRGAGGGVRRFAIMLSVGPGASVIHRMERHGRSAAGHLAYLEPVGEEVSEPRLAAVTAGRWAVGGGW
ncbi:MAG: acylglycerol kinase family protein [Phycisphaerales bacterium]